MRASIAFSRFLKSLVLTLFFAMVAVAGGQAWRELLLTVFVYVLALVWRDYRFGSEHLFVDELRTRARWERKEIFLFGHVLSDEKAERQERQDLAFIVGSGRYLQSVAVYGAMMGLLGTWLLHSSLGLPQGYWLIVLMGVPLALASHASQLLLALHASLVLVLFGAWQERVSAALAVVYAILFFLTLALYREALTAGAQGAEKNESQKRLPLREALRQALVFLIFLGFFELLLPEPRPMSGAQASHSTPRREKRFTEGIAKAAAEQVTKLESARPFSQGEIGRGSGDETSGEAGGESGGEAAFKSGGGQFPSSGDLKPEDLAKWQQELNRASAMTEGELKANPLAQDVRELDQALRNGTMSPEEFEKERRRLIGQMSEFKQVETHGQGKGQGAQALADSNAGANSGSGGVKKAGVGAPLGADAQQGGASSALVKGIAEVRQGKGLEGTKKDDVLLKDKAEAINQKIEMRTENFALIIKVILVGGVVFYVLRFLFRLTSKPSAAKAKRVRLSQEERATLQALLSRIRKRELSPSEEVIESYHALLEVFAAMRLPRAEHVPAADFSKQVSVSLPAVSEPMKTATSCFERTLYGDMKVEAERLQSFRKAVRSVLWYFNL
jgi:hypothetical protein